MNIFIEKGNRRIEKKFEGTAMELLSVCSINPETVLVTRNNSLITLDAKLKDSDDVKILSVISGG